jgi:hypothetical protein
MTGAPKLDPKAPLPHELTPEGLTHDGRRLYRFTFRRTSPDLSEAFYELVSRHLARMGYDHRTIHCPEGYPQWLTKLFLDFEGYGLPVELTPEPMDMELIAAVESAIGERYDPLKWPTVAGTDDPVDARSASVAADLTARIRTRIDLGAHQQ